MRRYGFLLALCLGLALSPALPAQAQDNNADAAQIKKLIGQLGSPSYMQREKARVELEKIGLPALPALKDAVNNSDQEVSKSAATLVEKLQELETTTKLLSPKMVHFKCDEVPVSEAIKELNRLTGYNIVLQGDQTVLGRKRITIDTGKQVPFWQAFDLLCEKAGLSHVPTQPGGYNPPPKYSTFDIAPGGVIMPAPALPVAPAPPPVKIKGVKKAAAAAQPAAAAAGGRQIAAAQPGFNPATGSKVGGKQPYSNPGAPIIVQEGGSSKTLPTCYHGAVRIQALAPVLVNNEWQLTLRVSAEPGVENFTLVGAGLVEKAVDEHGQVLDMVMKMTPNIPYSPYADGNVYYQNPNLPKQTQMQVHLKPGAKASNQLKELKGKLHASMLLPTEPLVTIKEVTKAAGKKVEGKGGGALALQSIKKIDDKRYSLDVHIENPPGMNNIGPNFQVVGGGQVIIQGGNVVINGNMINNNNPTFGSLVLVDAQGKSYRYYTMTKNQTVFANGKISRQMTVIYEADAGQGEPDQLLLVGRRLATVAIPYHFENLSLK